MYNHDVWKKAKQTTNKPNLDLRASIFLENVSLRHENRQKRTQVCYALVIGNLLTLGAHVIWRSYGEVPVQEETLPRFPIIYSRLTGWV